MNVRRLRILGVAFLVVAFVLTFWEVGSENRLFADPGTVLGFRFDQIGAFAGSVGVLLLVFPGWFRRHG